MMAQKKKDLYFSFFLGLLTISAVIEAYNFVLAVKRVSGNLPLRSRKFEFSEFLS